MLSVRKMVHELSFDEVRQLINLHYREQTRMNMLLEEYKGHNAEIENMPAKSEGKANNKISHAFPYIISSTITGFMNQKPVIRCDEQELIDDVFKYNDADKQNTSILLDMSIWGVGVEQFYIDSKANIRFKRIDARDIIAVKSSTIDGGTFCVIKHFEVDGLGDDKEEFIELYYDTKIVRYYENEKGVHSITEEDHFFGMPPFIIYKNNEQMLGDFERILPIVGAYNKYQSEVLNATQDISNALLVLSGVNLTEEQMHLVSKMRVLADENTISAQMVYNDVPFAESYLKQLRKDIFALSGCIDLTGEEVGNLSGSALRQRLVNLFYICSVKANYLKEGYLKRIELIMTIASLTSNIDVDKVIKNTQIEIKYNTLEDYDKVLNLVNGLKDVVSQETLLSFLGELIVSVDDELNKLAKEKEKNMQNLPQALLNSQQGNKQNDNVEEAPSTSEDDMDEDMKQNVQEANSTEETNN